MSSHHPYPPHLTDPSRVELAISILQKETRKRFLGLDDTAQASIDQSIRGWVQQPETFHLEANGLQDFWDIFAAEMESIKLKPGFSRLITAKNITWSRGDLSLSDIRMSSALDQIHTIPGLKVRNDLPFAELNEALEKNPPSVRNEQRAIVDRHSADPQQDTYPILALKINDDTLYMAMDGNRRTLRALLHDKSTIDAWIGKMDGKHPTNYWVPLNDMFCLVNAFKTGDEQTGQAAAVLLRHLFANQAGRAAYRNRIYASDTAAQHLYDMATA